MIAERFSMASIFLAFPQIDCPYSCEILRRGALKTKPVNECCKMLTPPGQFVKENEGGPRAGQPGVALEKEGSRRSGGWTNRNKPPSPAPSVIINQDGDKVPTRCFKMHYSDSGVHAVPRFDKGGEPDDV